MRNTTSVQLVKKVGTATLGLILFACAHLGAPVGEAVAGFDHTHADWKSLIDQHVTADGAVSLVTYPKLIADKKRLNDYVAKLGAVSAQEYEGFSRDEKITFLVNAYNAFTIQQIVEVYPVGSIQEIEFEPGVDAWHKKKHKILGQVISLDELENEWIRPRFKEPLVHFALNCASMGCPGLRWYSAKDFTAQATDAAKTFLSDSRRTVYDAKSKTLKMSELFDWYKDDFIAAKGSVAAYLATLMKARSEIEALNQSGKLKIEMLPYDWALNEKK